MKTNINLLPDALRGRSDFARFSNYLRSAAIIAAGGLIIVGLLSGAYMLFLTSSIASAKSASGQVQDQIESIDTVEQQFILVKDRVEKIKPFLAARDSGDNIALFNSLVGSLPAGVKINDAEIEVDSIQFTFTTPDSRDLIGVFGTIAKGDLGSVTIENFSFNSTIGYVVSVVIQLK